VTSPRRQPPSASAADASRRLHGAAPSAVAPGAASVSAALPTAVRGRRPALDVRAWLTLVAWVVGTVAIGAGVGLLAGPDRWYAELAKPTWNPPEWLFAPVWTALYATIGLAAWMIGREPDASPGDRRMAWAAFALQAVLNLAWTPLFFGLHAPGLAFLDLCVLWLAVLAMTLLFGRIRPLAGYLMAPYVLWVSFALVLNGTIWLMN
jgi:benzodiazapine receptor